MNAKEVAARFTVGTEIYYKGDMANSDGYGRITAIRQPTKWNPLSVDVRLDDDREMRGIFAQLFRYDGCGPGWRFEYADDHLNERQRKIVEFTAQAKRAMAEVQS
jgi:hypothetical protein